MINTKLQIHKAQRTPRLKIYIYSTSRHIIIKLQKIKEIEKILKEAKAGKMPYLQRSKCKNYIRLLFRNHASKKRVE